MAGTLVASASDSAANANPAALSFTIHADAEEGDVIEVGVGFRDNTSTITGSGGSGTWVQPASLIRKLSTGGSACQLDVLRYQVHADDTPGTTTLTVTGSTNFRDIAIAWDVWRGVDLTADDFDSAQTGFGSTATAPSIDTTEDDETVKAFCVIPSGAAYSADDVTELHNVSPGGGLRLVVQYEVQATAGSTGTETFSAGASTIHQTGRTAFLNASGATNHEAAAALAFALSASADALAERLAAASLSFVVDATVAAERTAVASATLPVTLGASATLRRELAAAAALSWTFDLTSQASIVKFAAAQLLMELGVSSLAQRTAIASSDLGLTLGLSGSGQRTTFGAAALPIVTSLSAQAVRTAIASATLGQVLSLTADAVIDGEILAEVLLELTMGLAASAVVTRNAAGTLEFVTGLDAVAQATRFAAASLELEMILQAAFGADVIVPPTIINKPFSRLQNHVYRRTTRRR